MTGGAEGARASGGHVAAALSSGVMMNWWNERDLNPHLPLARRGLSRLSYHPVRDQWSLNS
jgi:hypothetical protein